LGGQLSPEARLVRAPLGIVNYRPEEMTVQVRAGTTVSDLDAGLLESGQRCALPDRGGTVGGAVAVGEDHRDVLGRGPVRDCVLQVRYISAEGKPVTGGGPVVKNVSGFNLPKLMVGSLGSLGCFGEFVLRTNPIPACSIWLASDDLRPSVALDRLFKPSSILWDGTTTWIHLEGHGPDVAAERSSMTAVCSFEEVDGPPSLPSALWSVAPSDIEKIDHDQAGRFVASAGVGRVWATAPQRSESIDAAVQMLGDRMKANFDPTGRLNPGRRR